MTKPASSRIGAARIWTTGILPPEDVVRIASQPGSPLGASRKSRVVRVDEWVVKKSRFQLGAGAVRLTASRTRYRNAFHAGLYLAEHGIAVPAIAGYVEWGAAGVVWRNALVMRHLEGFAPVRDHALALENDTSARTVFLETLADSVLRLYRAETVHSDLASKNVLMKKGEPVHFIDFDAVRTGCTATNEARLRNLVQLLDAFYDIWPDSTLRTLVEKLLPPDETLAAWDDKARAGLTRRIEQRGALEVAAVRRINRFFRLIGKN